MNNMANSYQLNLRWALYGNQAQRTHFQRAEQYWSENSDSYAELLISKFKDSSIEQLKLLLVLIDRYLNKKKHQPISANPILIQLTLLTYEAGAALKNLQEQILPIISKLIKRLSLGQLSIYYDHVFKLIANSNPEIQLKTLRILTAIVQSVRRKSIRFQKLTNLNLKQIVKWKVHPENLKGLCRLILELMKLKKYFKSEIIHQILRFDLALVAQFLKQNQAEFETWEQKRNLIAIMSDVIKSWEDWTKLQCDTKSCFISFFGKALAQFIDRAPVNIDKNKLMSQQDILFLIEWSFKTVSSWPNSQKIESCEMSIHQKMFKIFQVFFRRQNFGMIIGPIKCLQASILKSNAIFNVLCYQFLGFYMDAIDNEVDLHALSVKCIQDLQQNRYPFRQLLYEFLIQYADLKGKKQQHVRQFVIYQLKDMKFEEVRTSMKLIIQTSSVNCLSQLLLETFDRMNSQQKANILRTLWNVLQKTEVSYFRQNSIFDTIFALIDNDFGFSEDSVKIEYLYCLQVCLKLHEYDIATMKNIYEFFGRFPFGTSKLWEQIVCCLYMFVRRLNSDTGDYMNFLSQIETSLCAFGLKLAKIYQDNLQNQSYRGLIIQLIQIGNKAFNEQLFLYFFQEGLSKEQYKQWTFGIAQLLIISETWLKQHEYYAKEVLKVLRKKPEYYRFYHRFAVFEELEQPQNLPQDTISMKWYLLSYIAWKKKNQQSQQVISSQPRSRLKCQIGRLNSFSSDGIINIDKFMQQKENDGVRSASVCINMDRQLFNDEDDVELVERFKNMGMTNTRIPECVVELQKMQENQIHWFDVPQNSSFYNAFQRDFKAKRTIKIIRKINQLRK